MSRVVFEYLAAGRPLVASRVGVVPEVLVDGEHARAGAGGRRRRPGRPRSPRLLDDAPGRARLGEAGRRLVVERFSGARLAAALEAHYARLTAGVKISILAFDLSDNATGRADLLARLLAPRWPVEVVGPRFGDEIWRPARGSGVPYAALAVGSARRYPRFAASLARAGRARRR